MEPEAKPNPNPKRRRRRHRPAAQQKGAMATISKWRGTVGTIIGTVLGAIGMVVTLLSDLGVDTTGVCDGHETVRFIERQEIK